MKNTPVSFSDIKCSAILKKHNEFISFVFEVLHFVFPLRPQPRVLQPSI